MEWQEAEKTRLEEAEEVEEMAQIAAIQKKESVNSPSESSARSFDCAHQVRISVRGLVEFILRHGDLDNSLGYSDPDAMQEGVRLHKKIQKSMGAS